MGGRTSGNLLPSLQAAWTRVQGQGQLMLQCNCTIIGDPLQVDDDEMAVVAKQDFDSLLASWKEEGLVPHSAPFFASSFLFSNSCNHKWLMFMCLNFPAPLLATTAKADAESAKI